MCFFPRAPGLEVRLALVYARTAAGARPQPALRHLPLVHGEQFLSLSRQRL